MSESGDKGRYEVKIAKRQGIGKTDSDRQVSSPAVIDKLLQDAIELDQSGRHDQAATLYRKLLDRIPGHPHALYLLGSHALRQEDHDEAIRLISAAIAAKVDEPMFHLFLGHAFMAARRWQEAANAYVVVCKTNPSHTEARFQHGMALKHLGDTDAAIDTFRTAMQIDTESPGAGIQLAKLLREQGALADALVILQQLRKRHPDIPELNSRYGFALLAAEKFSSAQQVFQQLFHLRRGSGLQGGVFKEQLKQDGAPLSGDNIQASPFFFRNLAGQIRHLVKKRRINDSFLQLASIYENICDQHQGLGSDFDFITLTDSQADRVRPYLFHAIHIADSAPVAGTTVSPELNCTDIENDYLASTGPMAVIDGFLSQAALESLRDFLLESSIFFRQSHNTFVSSYVDEGFNCSVLYRIATELKQRFPRVLGDKELRNMWVYRQPPEGDGVRAHSDQAAVTFNFWITPDEANLDTEHGGLIVYDKHQPLDWDWYSTNNDKDQPEVLARITDYLADASAITIPYRENRAVMFHSNLFHCSDCFHFREGYENSRMNVTLLFGDHPMEKQPI